MRSKISIIIADETDNVKYYTENRINIDEECIYFTEDLSDEYI